MRILRSVESNETTGQWREECGEDERMVEVIETTNESNKPQKRLLAERIRRRNFWS